MVDGYVACRIHIVHDTFIGNSFNAPLRCSDLSNLGMDLVFIDHLALGTFLN